VCSDCDAVAVFNADDPDAVVDAALAIPLRFIPETRGFAAIFTRDACLQGCPGMSSLSLSVSFLAVV